MNVTVKESILVRAPPEDVWDFTQDWTRRSLWIPSIRAAELLPGPERKVRATTTGGTFVVRYKLFDRPRRTSLAMSDSTSLFFVGGGGSWDYASEEGGTRFTQQNTLALRPGLAARVLSAVVRWQLRRATLQALRNAKRIIEAQAR